jgi:hypothetical protein
MARVRIKKLPKALSGLEIKMQPGLYGTNGNRQFTLSTQVNSQKFAQQPTEVRNTLQPVPRNEANLEAEKGETAVVNIDGMPAHFKIGGKRHSQGGTPLNLPDNSFIFSDTAKMRIKDPNILAQFGMSAKKGGYTPAEIAKKYDINKYRQILSDPNTEDVERKTAELMISNYNMKLAKLGLAQESMKGFPQGIPVMAMPYVIANNVNPADYFPTEAQEDEPDADTGEQRYGGNIIAQFATKAHGGMHFAGYPYYQEGAEKWTSYSGENDPNKSYWERVKSANLFQRPSSETVDPRMMEAYEKLIPFYGKDAGFGEHLKNLWFMPQYELNNLLTGYYENPYTTYRRYNPEPEGFWGGAGKLAMKYGTDPMIIDLPYNLLAKGATKAAKKIYPYGPKLVQGVKDLTVKYGKPVVDAAVKQAKKLYDKITPEMVEKIIEKSLKYSGKFTQALLHGEDEDTPKMFTAAEKAARIKAVQDDIDKMQGTTFKPQQQVKEKPKQDVTSVATPTVPQKFNWSK